MDNTLDSIKKLLLIEKGPTPTGNTLAMFGLYPIDFHGNLDAIVGSDGITIRSDTFSDTCTCYQSGKNDPKLERLADGTMHTVRCDLAMAQKIMHHPCLTYVDRVEGEGTYWSFDWPRDIEPNKNVIQSVFPELESETLWASFKHRWEEITADMGPQPQSLYEASQEGDFDGDIPFDTTEPMEETVSGPEQLPIPEEPAIPPKRRRGRPAGTTNAAKVAKHDIPADASAAPQEDESGNIVIPACQRFAQIAADELGRLCDVVAFIATADEFPVENIRGLKESLDRLALRAAHLELKGRHDAGDEGCLELWVETTLANVRAATNAAIRDLDLSPEKPTAWEKFGKDLKEIKDKAESMNKIMVQPGMSAAIQETMKPVE